MLPLREWRERVKKTQAEVADAIGIDRTAYTRLESGQRDIRLGEASRLFDALSLSPEERSEALRLAGALRKGDEGEAA
jgi:transcriptional regulator with XRE-family HTH domain